MSRRALIAAAALAAVILGVGWVRAARRANGADGFPLDDPWIHLTYARTLAEDGTFAYGPGAAPTQGSTSPLFTLLLAAGLRATSNEKVLAYVLGIAFQAAFLAATAAWAAARVRPGLLAAAVVAVVALDPRLVSLSVSGMETSLFLALVAGTFAAYASDRLVLAGVAAGLAVWARPEGLILIAVLAVDAALRARWEREPAAMRGLVRGALAAAAIVAAYVAFNLAVGHRALPNTFGAKTAFYAANSRSGFVVQHAVPALLGGGLAALAPLWVLLAIRAPRRLARRLADPVRAETGFAAALVLAYLVFLPYGHRFERYLMPALPALAVALAAGASAATDGMSARRRTPAIGAIAALLALAAVGQAWALPAAREDYVSSCRYHARRHERAGRWLAEHTPPSAVVATHDVGAIAFYSRRRIVDTVGVVFPEAVGHLNRPDYDDYLRRLFDREGVTHLAVLRNWLEVSNVEPLFVADPEPEILEIYPWISGRTHLVPREASRRHEDGARLLAKDPEAALAAFRDSIRLDPANARARMSEGLAFEAMRRLPEAEASYRAALERNPDAVETRFRLAVVLAAQSKRDEARALAAEVVGAAPGRQDAAALYRLLSAD